MLTGMLSDNICQASDLLAQVVYVRKWGHYLFTVSERMKVWQISVYISTYTVIYRMCDKLFLQDDKNDKNKAQKKSSAWQ